MALENVKFFVETAGRDKKDIRNSKYKVIMKIFCNIGYAQLFFCYYEKNLTFVSVRITNSPIFSL
jgi:hypothetical protein